LASEAVHATEATEATESNEADSAIDSKNVWLSLANFSFNITLKICRRR
jgi:hypothetical protein